MVRFVLPSQLRVPMFLLREPSETHWVFSLCPLQRSHGKWVGLATDPNSIAAGGFLMDHDERARDAAREITPAQTRSPDQLEIPVGTPTSRDPGGPVQHHRLKISVPNLSPILMVVGTVMIVIGLVFSIRAITDCWEIVRCQVGFGWYSGYGPYLSGTGALGPMLVFLGTTLWAMAYALRLRRRFKDVQLPSNLP